MIRKIERENGAQNKPGSKTKRDGGEDSNIGKCGIAAKGQEASPGSDSGENYPRKVVIAVIVIGERWKVMARPRRTLFKF